MAECSFKIMQLSKKPHQHASSFDMKNTLSPVQLLASIVHYDSQRVTLIPAQI